MPAKIIAITNQKGGTGKTTISIQLAGEFVYCGFDVLIVDADKQGTATRWAAAAPDERPFPASIAGLSAAGQKVHREVRKFVNNYDFIIIDCPPAVESTVPTSALMIADLALIPIIPSPPDLWAAIGIRELVSNIKETANEGLVARLVPNMCQSRTEVAREVLDILNEFGIPALNTRINQRTANRQAAAYGCTSRDLGRKAFAATAEFEALTDEVLALLDISRLMEVVNG